MAEPRGPLMSPGFWLHHAALEWRATVERNLRPLGLTLTQFNLLASAGWLGRQGAELPTQQQVVDMAGADRMMGSRVIRVLEDRALLVRRPDPDDARILRIEVTADGRDLARRAIRIVVDTDQQVFGPDSDALRDQLKTIAARRGGR
ncbi:MarR family transcriptional regulator [Nocardia sp. NPDC004604]|uniref:MarR family winged helix-turn-helix transcriptional regulator n=1 Tax=Nocardia sp. NPDC004604 TaxID=3157013 RepID=UPI0033BAFEC5